MSKYGELLDHEYDGIREYDNPTPGWWHMIFAASIVFSIVYFAFFSLSPIAPTPERRHAAAELRKVEQQFAAIGELQPTAETIMTYSQDQDWMSFAGSLFASNCKSCHGASAEGLIGPNLTDEYFKNVVEVTDIYRVISEGAGNLAMPAQRNRLHPNEIVLLSSYVASLRGRNLPGRPREGELINPWPPVPAPLAASGGS